MAEELEALSVILPRLDGDQVETIFRAGMLDLMGSADDIDEDEVVSMLSAADVDAGKPMMEVMRAAQFLLKEASEFELTEEKVKKVTLLNPDIIPSIRRLIDIEHKAFRAVTCRKLVRLLKEQGEEAGGPADGAAGKGSVFRLPMHQELREWCDGLLVTEMFGPSLNANTGDWTTRPKPTSRPSSGSPSAGSVSSSCFRARRGPR